MKPAVPFMPEKTDWSLYQGQQVEINGIAYAIAKIEVLEETIPLLRRYEFRILNPANSSPENPKTIRLTVMPKPNYSNYC